jgi:hypothetical protein
MTYKRIGIRRDRNLGDLQDKGLSLNNLLDTLVDGTSSTFISEDLDAIRNIFAYNLESAGYREIIGSRVQFTNNNGSDIDFLPRITYQNRLDKLKIFSGTPRINGGNGLTAKYYNKIQVFENTTAVFSGTPIKQDNFWEDGNFDYSGKITPEAVDVNGGVEWSGYFIPTASGSHRFEIRTSALMTLEFETEGYTSGIGTYTEHSRIGLSSTFVGSGGEGNAITLATPSNTKFIGIGQSVSNANIVVGTVVEGYNTGTGVITLTPPSGSVNAITSEIASGSSIVFSKAIGQETQIFHSTYALEKQRRYHFRLRYYIPQSINAINVVRYFNIDILRPNDNADDDLRYNYLYASDYDFSQSAKGDFNIFLDNSVLAGGGTTLGSSSESSKYVKIKSTKKIDIKYSPKTSLTAITKATVSGTTTNNTKVISIADTSGIGIGNFIFGTGIPENTVVDDIVINNFIITSTASTASGTSTLTFIDHRGFVKRGVGSISGTTLTLSSGNTTNLKSKMVVIGNGVTQYTGITTTGFASTVTVSPSQTVGAGTTFYFYQSRGLIDEGLAAFCVPAVTRCIFTSSSVVAGSTSLNVVDTTGVVGGMRVLGAQFANGTTVSSVSESPTRINITIPTIAGIASGGNFTVTSTPANEGDRSLCCPPTDTSPPFNPTENGLDTTVGFPNLKINGGNIKFDSLTATVSGGNITNIATNDASTKRLPIQTASGLFNILCE